MKFVENIHTFGPEYNKNFSTFQEPLPEALKCPFSGSCKGGISSSCNVGYKGILCATCSDNHYLRFNRCLQCPKMVTAIILCLLVILAFALLFLFIFLGDSVEVRRHTEEDGNARPEDDGEARFDDDGNARAEDNINPRTENNGNVRLEDDGNTCHENDGYTRTEDDGNLRTKDDADARPRFVADVIMSCAKIVIGFYQVVAGIFSALVRVRWPTTLIRVEKVLKYLEGNFFQFAPLRCIHPLLGLDPFQQFGLAIAINAAIVFLTFLYFLLKKWYINRMKEGEEEKEEEEEEKQKKISKLKGSCYRNIFLFLLLSYPVTSKKIIGILPLAGVCVKKCFTKDKTECVSLLKADYSIHCFTHQHNVVWPIALAFAALFSVLIPFLLYMLIRKYHHNIKPHLNPSEITFGLRVFCENYKEKYWYWEIVEMYRKLSLISFILLIDSESPYKIGFAVITASTSGIAYTIFRPIKDPFEDRLQTFALWVTFFNVCLGAIYLQPDVCSNHAENKSVLVNAVFLVLNGAVLCSLVLQWSILSKSSALKVT